MTEFPVKYEAGSLSIKLDGEGGASVMLAFLLKAKFGDAFDPETLFHPQLAQLMVHLKNDSLTPQGPAELGFTRDQVCDIAQKIVGESWSSGWWQKTNEEQVAFLQNVVAAPYTFSPQQIDEIFDEIAAALYWRKRIVMAAEAEEEDSSK